MGNTISAFTSKANGIANKLISPTKINSMGGPFYDANALWDTGATNTCISQKLAAAMNLVPTGKIQMKTPSGEGTQNTYLVNILLPNNVMVKDAVVCGSEIHNQGLDLLIGMDIISGGDFSISNYKGKTYFSFRMPSQGHSDFVTETRLNAIIGKQHGKGKKKKRN